MPKYSSSAPADHDQPEKESFLYVRTNGRTKGRWVKAANKESLTLEKWVTEKLNNEADRVLGEDKRFAKPPHNDPNLPLR